MPSNDTKRGGGLVRFTIVVIILMLVICALIAAVKFFFVSYPESLVIWAKGGEYAVELQGRISELEAQVSELEGVVTEKDHRLASLTAETAEARQTAQEAEIFVAQARDDLDIVQEANLALQAQLADLQQTLSLMTDWKAKYEALKDEKGEQLHFSVASLITHPIEARFTPGIGQAFLGCSQASTKVHDSPEQRSNSRRKL